jgi:hypothetical protein
MFIPSFISRTLLEEWRGEQSISPPEDNFTLRSKKYLLGDIFAPRGQSLPLGAKLRMGLWHPVPAVRPVLHGGKQQTDEMFAH